MSITRRADYGVRLMYELAQLPEGTSLSIRDACEAAEIPSAFAESIVPFLVVAEMVRASGYRGHLLALARPASEISMAEVVRACEPAFSLSPCVISPESCTRSGHCGVHRMWASLDSLVWQQLEGITLADVASETWSRETQPGGVVAAGLLGIA